MKYEVVPSKTKDDTRLDRTRKLTLTAHNEWDEVKLGILVRALKLLDDENDPVFQGWMQDKLEDYCKRHGLRVIVTK